MIDLKQFRKTNNLTQIELAKFLRVNPSFIGNIETGRSSLPDEKLTKILSNTSGWDTSMLTSDASTNVTSTIKGNNNATSVNIASDNVSKKPQEPNKTNELTNSTANYIPVIPSLAHAGSLIEYTDGYLSYQCEKMLSPFPGASCAIKVIGDSMEPKYPEGSIVILKKVNENIFIDWHKTYVLDTDNGAILKQLIPAEDSDKVTCVSLNSKYTPFDIEKKYINGWYRVLGSVTID